MSTNKRKESAALFELLDKSTLKVPKHAGALKIPSWWSSKTNPAPVPIPEIPDAPETPSLNGTTAAPSPQQRLFEPPPATATPTNSPSIRPPAASSAAHPAVRIISRPAAASAPPSNPANHAPTTTETSPEKSTPRPIPSPETPSRRVFAPQSYDQTTMARRHWMGQKKRMVARTSPWAVFAAGGGVIVVFILVAWLILRHHGKPAVTTPATAVDLGSRKSNSSYVIDRGSSQPLIPGNTASLLPPQPPILQSGSASSDQTAAQSDTPGKVYGPSELNRDDKLLYIIIASTSQSEVAKKNADFLAQNGIDVSIERLRSPKGNTALFTLISAKGFPTLSEAEAYKKRIVLIGHKTVDFQKTRKAWDDAYAQHVHSLAASPK